LAPIILESMWDVVTSPHKNKTFVFPVLISHLLHKKGIPLATEFCLTNEANILSTYTLLQMHMKLTRQGIWKNPHRRTKAQGIPIRPRHLPPNYMVEPLTTMKMISKNLNLNHNQSHNKNNLLLLLLKTMESTNTMKMSRRSMGDLILLPMYFHA